MKRGWAGLWGTVCLNLAYLAKRRDILTGTPAPQGAADLEALFNFLWPNQARRILPEGALGGNGRNSEVAGKVATAIRPLFVRTTKHELQLRRPDYDVIEVPLRGIQAAIYTALIDHYVGEFLHSKQDRLNLARMGQFVMYLLEAATNPALLAAGSSRYDPIEFHHPPLEVLSGSRLADLLSDYARYETPRKFLELAGLINKNASLGWKTLVWSNFVRNLESLEHALVRYRPALIHGGIPSEIAQPHAVRTREKELARFREDNACLVLLANPAATSEGVSLHQICHHAVYLDRTFNAGQYLQSVDRIHRLGLREDQETKITFLVTLDTVDETVDMRVREKAEALSRMLNDPAIVTMALPDDEDYGPAIESEQDLAALFAHLREAHGN